MHLFAGVSPTELGNLRPRRKCPVLTTGRPRTPILIRIVVTVVKARSSGYQAKLANETTFPKRPCQDFFRRAVIVNNDAKTFCATTGRRDMTDLDWPMVGVYLVMLMGAVLLLSALSMRGTRLRLPNALSPSE